jgi:uncharacterized membrane protein YgaE (UPF0421/DUF939 family)
MMDFVVKIMTAVCIVVVVVTLEVMAFSIAKTIVETSDDYLKRKLKERRGEHSDDKEKETESNTNLII